MKKSILYGLCVAFAVVGTICGCAKPEEAAPGYVDSPAGTTSQKGAPPTAKGKGNAVPSNQRRDDN